MVDTCGTICDAGMIEHTDKLLGAERIVYGSDNCDFAGQVNKILAAEITDEEKKMILENAKREQAFQQILKEIQALKEKLSSPPPDSAQSPAGIARIEELLRLNDFSPEFSREIVQRMRLEFSLEDLDNESLLSNTVLEWIGEKIRLHPPLHASDTRARFFVVVGPTGVGKTTTIAKLAAIYGVGEGLSRQAPGSNRRAQRVKIMTIDNYRIGARTQIETYGEIMRLPVTFVETVADFKKAIALSEEGDLVLVDTIGKSPRDLAKLAEMKEILEAAGSLSETHLAVSATTKASDVEDILKQFEPFRYRSIILTKLDETSRVGNLISVLAKAGKPISYIADGQGVPQDLEEASVVRLLMTLDGFRLDREHLEGKFGKWEKISDRYWS